MKFEINPQSNEPIHLQLREQIIFRISTGELPIGHAMPSVRALGRQLDIAPNTVSHVYKELVGEKWLMERHGSQHIVVARKATVPNIDQIKDLGDLVSHTIQLAQERGYSLQQLAAQLHERLLEQPADHLLIIEPEREMGEVMREELRQAVGQAPSGCSISALRVEPVQRLHQRIQGTGADSAVQGHGEVGGLSASGPAFVTSQWRLPSYGPPHIRAFVNVREVCQNDCDERQIPTPQTRRPDHRRFDERHS